MKNEGGSLWREKEEDWLYWTQSSHWRMRYIGGTKEKEEEDDDDDSFPRVARHGRYLLLAMDDGVWCAPTV